MDADDLRHYSTNLSRGIELPLALTAFCSEMTHEVLIGVTQDVVAFGAIFREVERLVLKDCNEVGKSVHHFLAASELRSIVEVRHVRQLIGMGKRCNDLLVDPIADVALALEGDHVLETCAFGYDDRRVLNTSVLVADILDEQQYEDVVLVLAGIHASRSSSQLCQSEEYSSDFLRAIFCAVPNHFMRAMTLREALACAAIECAAAER